MNYHIVSISNAGHGAIFTNKAEAKLYQSSHPDSTLITQDSLPGRIPKKQQPQETPTDSGQTPTVGESGTSPIMAYTDGSSHGNPGPAGSGVVIMQNGTIIHEISEPLGVATNNIAELTAIKLALEYYQDSPTVPITIYSDSQYCIGCLTKPWKPKKNVELINSIKDIMESFTELDICHVKGHDGDSGNERADVLANQAAG